MDRRGLGYLRRDNCFVNLDNFERAERLANQQPERYYWTSEQTEWATDVCFRDAASLTDLFPSSSRLASV